MCTRASTSSPPANPHCPQHCWLRRCPGHPHINIDGTLIRTDRCSTPGPTDGVDLWWSGKHHHHGGNIQVISSPDGWPLWTSQVRPGREHDTTCLRTHPEMLPALALWTGDRLPAVADLGYEGEADLCTLPVKRPAGITHIPENVQFNLLQAHARARAEQANAVLKRRSKPSATSASTPPPADLMLGEERRVPERAVG